MQYILSQEEMDAVNELRKRVRLLPSVEKLQKECTHLADTLPTWKGWDGADEPEPWRCILSVDYEDHYCDECPVISICPKERKSYSK